MADKKKHVDTTVKLDMDIELALRKAVEAGPYPKEKPKSRPSRSAPRTKHPTVNLTEKLSKAFLVRDLARVVAVGLFLHVLVQVLRDYLVMSGLPKAFDALSVSSR